MAKEYTVDEDSNLCQLRSYHGGIYLLTFTGHTKHVFGPKAIQNINQALDKVEGDKDATVLVTTNEGKFFSNGMDAKYLRQIDTITAKAYMQTFQSLACRLLCFPIPTIAVIRGHAVGAGCMFALAHDYRLMSSNHGFIFMNELDIGMSLTPGNSELLRSKLPPAAYHEVLLTSRRFNAKEAKEVGLVHAWSSDPIQTLHSGLNKARDYASRKWKRDVYQALKKEIFKTSRGRDRARRFGLCKDVNMSLQLPRLF